MRYRSNLAAAMVTAALMAPLGAEANADTIHLKNGRLIHTADVEVAGERVIFSQYGGRIVVPLSIVERIERNEMTGPEAIATSVPGQAPATADEGGNPTGEEADQTVGDEQAAGDEQSAGEELAPEEPDPRQTRTYWRGRLEPLFSQMDGVERELARFRPLASTSADAQRRVERLEGTLATLESQVGQIRTEARRLGVAPGWLRR